MNILPKKRWHVRTKENIARVRKDEAEAAEKEKQEQLRIETADREARIRLLKDKSKQRLEEVGIFTNIEPPTPDLPSEHLNLFSDLDHAVKTTNIDHDKESKHKKEEYEKKIGYLTYLGQGTNEALKKKNWYEVVPESSRFSRNSEIKDTYDKLVLKDADGKPKIKEVDIKNGEVSWKAKQSLDPLNSFRKYCPEKPDVQLAIAKPVTVKNDYTSIIDTDKHKHKSSKKKKHKEDKEKKIQKLREARHKREMQERLRTELFLKQGTAEPPAGDQDSRVNKINPKYNSQFNPELARQNYR